LCFNTRFFSRFLFSENIISIYLNQVFKSSSFIAKRHCLLKKLRDNDSLVMRSCNHCFHHFMKCRVETDFNHYVECMHLDRKCNLIISKTEWEWIHKKWTHLCAELSETLTKAAHLQKQQELIKFYWKNIMQWKFKNIEELKKNKCHQMIKSFINDLLLNIDFKQLKISSDFNWLLNFFAETITEAFNNSWDFSLILKCFQYVHNFFTWLINEIDF